MQSVTHAPQEPRQIPEPLVSIIEDDPDVSRSIIRLLATVGLASQAFNTGQDALESINTDRPGCLIADMRLPDRDGLDVIQDLREQGVTLPAIVITAYADVPSAVRAMKLGVADFLEKPFAEQQFIAAVQRSVDQHVKQFQAELQQSEIQAKLSTLSDRERQVLKGIIAGHSSKIIGGTLDISQKTVENYRASLMKKLDADNAAHLVSLVLAHVD